MPLNELLHRIRNNLVSTLEVEDLDNYYPFAPDESSDSEQKQLLNALRKYQH